MPVGGSGGVEVDGQPVGQAVRDGGVEREVDEECEHKGQGRESDAAKVLACHGKPPLFAC